MQLLFRIIAFLLLSQYEVSSGRVHFARELQLFQDSLVEKLYDDTSLNPQENNDEIEDIIDSILDEADRRLRRRKRSRTRHLYHEDEDNRDDDDDNDNDINSEEYNGDSKSHQAYKKALASAYSAIVQDYKSKKKDRQSKDGKKQYKKLIKETEYAQSINSKREDDSFMNDKKTDNDVDNDEVLVSDNGDNVQVASVDVDNSDNKVKGINNQKLFLEINTTNEIPPKKIITSNYIDKSSLDKVSFIAVIVGCVVAGIAGIALAFFCWYKLRNETKDYNAGGADRYKSHSLKTSDRKKTSDEEKLARGAEVFHYLHAKKQMQQMEEPNLKADNSAINESSDEEEDENTVYECPGLAPPGDMKVVNPLFSDTESHYSDTQSVQSTPTPPSEDTIKLEDTTSKSPTEY